MVLLTIVPIQKNAPLLEQKSKSDNDHDSITTFLIPLDPKIQK